MAPVHEFHKVVRGTETGGRREVAYLLIAPAAVVGVLAYRHELYMGVAHVLDIRNELIRKLAVRKVILAVLAPGAYVHFIDIRGAVVNILCVQLVKVLLVCPAESLYVVELRRGVGAELHVVSVGVSLELYQPVGAFYAVFVVVVLLDSRNEQLPDTAVAYFVHRVEHPVPVVEITDNADGFRVRSPYAEYRAALAVLHLAVGAEEVIGMGVLALVEKIQRNCVFFRNYDSHI